MLLFFIGTQNFRLNFFFKLWRNNQKGIMSFPEILSGGILFVFVRGSGDFASGKASSYCCTLSCSLPILISTLCSRSFFLLNSKERWYEPGLTNCRGSKPGDQGEGCWPYQLPHLGPMQLEKLIDPLLELEHYRGANLEKLILFFWCYTSRIVNDACNGRFIFFNGGWFSDANKMRKTWHWPSKLPIMVTEDKKNLKS